MFDSKYMQTHTQTRTQTVPRRSNRKQNLPIFMSAVSKQILENWDGGIEVSVVIYSNQQRE